MSDTPTGGPQAAPNPCAHLPSYGQLVGVWAKAMTQMWDMGIDWWKVGVEQAFPEDPRLRVWSTTLRYPRPPEPGVTLRCTAFVSVRGESVPLADVTLTPGEVVTGAGEQDVTVVVSRPLRHTTHLYTITIGEFPVVAGAAGAAPAPGQTPIRERTFRRGFGVPEG